MSQSHTAKTFVMEWLEGCRGIDCLVGNLGCYSLLPYYCCLGGAELDHARRWLGLEISLELLDTSRKSVICLGTVANLYGIPRWHRSMSRSLVVLTYLFLLLLYLV